jgi:hypothetical protein
MRLKAISPFIASVLLIGFTIASGVIVYYFVTTLPKVQTAEISSQASKVLSCAGATFDVKVRNCNLLNGLVLWLPMDEGSGTIAYDYSGYGNNGTLYSGSTVCSNPPNSGCPTWVDGMIGRAISFDGVDDYVNMSKSSSGYREYTLIGWFRTDKVAPDTDFAYRIVTVHRGAPSTLVSILLRGNDVSLMIFDGTAHRFLRVTKPYNDNNWHFLAGTAKNGEQKLYYDGALIGTFNYPFIIQTTTYTDKIGTFNGINGMFNGFIDEVRIYNRALSDEEIKQLYYNGLTNKFNITIGLLNFGYADLGKSFNAIFYLKNGTILQLPLILNRDLTKGSYLEKTLNIDGYYPSYGLIDKIMVCSNDCQGVCSEIIVNNQC